MKELIHIVIFFFVIIFLPVFVVLFINIKRNSKKILKITWRFIRSIFEWAIICVCAVIILVWRLVDDACNNRISIPKSQLKKIWFVEFMKTHYAIIIIGLSVVLALLNFSIIPFEGGDNFKYYLLGKSLAGSNGYREIWNIYNPLHTQYPPVFPMLLIPAAFFNSYIMAKITVLICFVIMLIFAYKLFKEINQGNEIATFTALGILAFAPVTIRYSSIVLSEIPYLMFSMIALYYFVIKKYWQAFLFGVLTALTRTVGISLMIALTIGYWGEN